MVWKIGLVNGFPNGVIEITIRGSRRITTNDVIKTATSIIVNQNVNNV
ncbi:hypothetical protein ACFPYJ_15015 [Paenibacillus solisilvae]|uniref:Uncharacterized protein n=1 Tax=Paenibacillus solisilvae TaxID=2486751 RepID=A0ABW0VX09_9BACL